MDRGRGERHGSGLGPASPGRDLIIMPRYKINHRYSSGDHGPYEEGNEVELTEEEAAGLNHDSPGLLDKVDKGKQAREKREPSGEIAKLYERNKARDLPGTAGGVLADGPVRSLG